MSVDLTGQSPDDIAREIFKPIEELLARENAELKQVDELIREAVRKSKPVLDPEP
jgi:hypothetical protein